MFGENQDPNAGKDTQFKPGNTEGLGRKPGSKNAATLVKHFFDCYMKGLNPITGKEEDLTVEQRMVLAQIGQSLKGNTKAFNSLMDRVYGKVALPVTGPEGEPLSLAPPIINVIGIDGEKKSE